MKNGESGWGYGRGERGVVISFTRFLAFMPLQMAPTQSLSKIHIWRCKNNVCFFFLSKKRANSAQSHTTINQHLSVPAIWCSTLEIKTVLNIAALIEQKRSNLLFLTNPPFILLQATFKGPILIIIIILIVHFFCFSSQTQLCQISFKLPMKKNKTCWALCLQPATETNRAAKALLSLTFLRVVCCFFSCLASDLLYSFCSSWCFSAREFLVNSELYRRRWDQ